MRPNRYFVPLAAALALPAVAVRCASARDAARTAREFMIPMRDSAGLHTVVLLPGGDGPFPAVLFRATYAVSTNSLASTRALRFAASGYAYAMQSTRGNGRSERGTAGQEFDGYDTIDWLAAQPWCNGAVGTVGSSALGETQLRTALQGHPAHRAMCPQVPSYGNSTHHYGGSLEFSRDLLNAGRSAVKDSRMHDWMPHLFRLPAISMADDPGLNIAEPRRESFRRTLAAYFDTPGASAFTDPRHFEQFKRLNTPNLMISGWYDHCLVAALEFYEHTMRHGTADQKQNTHLVIGPWDHDSVTVPDYEFGDEASRDHQAAEIAFFDRHLKGIAADAPPPVEYFVMGRNSWRAGDAWPPGRVEATRFYLRSNGDVQGAWRRGGLSPVAPDAEPPDRFIYDPLNPVPSWGGANSGPASRLPMRRGPRDQRITLYRKDVLTYFSDPLDEPLEVVGEVKLVLFAASSAKDTDFTAKLMDVAPCGDARLLCDGVIRARFREGLDRPKLLTPDEPVRYEISLWNTANCFLPGHRIALAISSSNFPRLSRNLNTGGDNLRDADSVEAEQTIFHDAVRPSHLILPAGWVHSTRP